MPRGGEDCVRTLAGGGEGGGRNSVSEAVLIRLVQEFIPCHLMRPSESFAASPDDLYASSICPPEKCSRQIVSAHSFRSKDGEHVLKVLGPFPVVPSIDQQGLESRWNFFHCTPLDSGRELG